MTSNPVTTLTQHQLELVALYASGYDHKAIAEAKYLSHSAVFRTLGRAKANVGAQSLAHLCTLSLESGAIQRYGDGFRPVIDPTVVG